MEMPIAEVRFRVTVRHDFLIPRPACGFNCETQPNAARCSARSTGQWRKTLDEPLRHSCRSSEASTKEHTFTRKKPFSPIGESVKGLAAGRSVQGPSTSGEYCSVPRCHWIDRRSPFETTLGSIIKGLKSYT